MVDSSLCVRTSPIVLMRIMSNLVSNAVKYTHRGKVLIGVRRSGVKAVLCVADTGPGMSENDLARFREAYQKGESSEGHGLGLSVCFDLARQHGLELAVNSVPGRGTQFRLGVPRVEP
jgi:signal transduction histidine kinase